MVVQCGTCDCFCLDKNADNYKVKNKYCNDVKKKHGEVLDKGIEMGGGCIGFRRK